MLEYLSNLEYPSRQFQGDYLNLYGYSLDDDSAGPLLQALAVGGSDESCAYFKRVDLRGNRLRNCGEAVAGLLRANAHIASVQLGDNSRPPSPDLTPESLLALQPFAGRVALDGRPLGTSGLLRRYQAADGSSIMSLIKNKIGHPKAPLTVSARPPDSGRRDFFGQGKENKSLLANVPVKAREDRRGQQPSSDSQLTVPHRPPSTEHAKDRDKSRGPPAKPDSQCLMMSRIGWLFELRNLFDKLKRKSNGGPVAKDLFLDQFKRVAGVRALSLVHEPSPCL